MEAADAPSAAAKAKPPTLVLGKFHKKSHSKK
jgi:hypothetical protein